LHNRIGIFNCRRRRRHSARCEEHARRRDALRAAEDRPIPALKPVLPALEEALRATPHGLETFLVTSHGKPFTDGGIGNKMRGWCDQAGLPECTSHGLKKVAATICANMGATDRQLMVLFDWTSVEMANVYTRQANKEKLAAECATLGCVLRIVGTDTDREQTKGLGRGRT
jgi:integrase